VQSAKNRIEREAADALALAKASLAQAARNLYEAGRALVVLRKPGYAEAAGFEGGFYELCSAALDLSRTSADRLIDAATQMSQEQYAAFRTDRADALLDLATATKEDDTAAILRGDRIRLWAAGPLFDVKKAKTAEVRAAAKAVRVHYESPSAKRRGRTASADERKLESDSNRKLDAAGSSARAKVRATKAGKPSVFDLTGLSASELARAVRALAR
jgi:hypothetical protein